MGFDGDVSANRISVSGGAPVGSELIFDRRLKRRRTGLGGEDKIFDADGQRANFLE